MRKQYSEYIEAGRVTEGDFASPPGQQCGAFQVRHPKTGAMLCILAGDADARAWAESGLKGKPWEHVSVHAQGRHYDRVPTWEEISWVKEQFWEDEECVVQFHPPKSRYINTNPHTLHLWWFSGEFPMPPIKCV